MKTQLKAIVPAFVLQGALAALAASPGGLADRVAAQVRAPGSTVSLPVTWYAVPALSPVKRLPDSFPEDGELGGAVKMVAARDEFEPASFLVFSANDIEKATLAASDLSGPGGTLPASCVDLKVVKCWYQSGTAWHSYFADNKGHELIPELLLNDETLVRVDASTRDNYLRVDEPEGSQYVWISNPFSVNVPFNAETTPVADAKTIQPFRLEAGLFKQFWITVKVPRDAAPGVYSGTLALSAAGMKPVSIPLAVRVLPFALPTPVTYYDPSREFYTMLYNDPQYPSVLKMSGGDRAHADRKMLAMFENMRDHNIRHPLLNRDFKTGFADVFTRQLELVREAGLATDPLFGAVPGIPPYGWMTSVTDVAISNQTVPPELIKGIDESSDIVKRLFGHSNVYCFGWDEPSRRLVVAERKPWTYLHDKGLKVYSTAQDEHLKYAAYNEDFVNIPGEVTRERSGKWHALGQRITNYAYPHTGPENPDFMRRVHGLALYKANYDGIGNYILTCQGWNDFLGDAYNFRGFNMTYPTRDSVVDTLEWEGIREAVDDVRYATLLKTMAAKAIATGKTESVYAGRRALQWLELMDEKSADLDTVRLEMIDRILALQAYAELPQAPVVEKAPVPASIVPVAPVAAALSQSDIVATNRLIMARPKLPVRFYRKALFAIIDALAAQHKSDDLKEVAVEAVADAKLIANDRFLAKLIVAGIDVGVNPEDLKREAGKAGAGFTEAELPSEARVTAIHEAGKIFMTMRQYSVVRAFLALADGMYRQEPKKSYVCRFVDKAPTTVDGWLASPLLKEAANRESQFVPYDRKAAELLIYDVNAERALATAKEAADKETAFYMAYDAAGWHMYVDCRDAETEKVEAGLLNGGQLEMCFAPGASECYYQWFVRFPQANFKTVSYNSPNRHYREMDPYGKADAATVSGGFGASVFIPWEMVYDKLPSTGTEWPFNVIRWTRAGGMTWHGKVHNIHDFGTVKWEGLTRERLAAIKRRIVMKAFGNYKKTRAEQVAFWKDAVLGDPEFYAQRLLPAVEKLDALGTKVDPAMSQADVESLFTDAVPDWMEFNFKTAELRRDYLAAKLVGRGR
jgi:hypothetical protein